MPTKTYQVTTPTGEKFKYTGPPKTPDELAQIAASHTALAQSPKPYDVSTSSKYNPQTGKTATTRIETYLDDPGANAQPGPNRAGSSDTARLRSPAPARTAPKLGPHRPLSREREIAPSQPTPNEIEAYRREWLDGTRPNARPAQVLAYLRHSPETEWDKQIFGFSDVGRAALKVQARAERTQNRRTLADKDANARASVSGMGYSPTDFDGGGSSFLTGQVLDALHERFNRATGALQSKRPVEEAPAGSAALYPALYDMAQTQKGVVPSVTRNILGMTTPDSLAMLAAAAPLGGAAPALGRAAGIGFGLSQVPQIKDRIASGDTFGALTDTAFAFGPEALHHAPAVINKTAPGVKRFGRAVDYAFNSPDPNNVNGWGAFTDPFGINATAQTAAKLARIPEGYRQIATLENLLTASGERKPFTLNYNWDGANYGAAPQSRTVDPRTARAQKVRPVAPPSLPVIDSGVGGAGKNGYLLASDKGAVNAVFGKAKERGHGNVMLSVGSREMSVSNMDAANMLVSEMRHRTDALKTATPGQVNRAIKDAAKRYNGRLPEGGKEAPASMRLDDLLPFLGGISFENRRMFVKLLANDKNRRAGVTPFWRDLANAINDPALVGKRANNGVAIGTLDMTGEKGGRAVSATEAKLPPLRSYDHFGKGTFDGFLPDIINYRDLESATPKTDARGRLNPLGFQNSLPEVTLPLSYYKKHFGVNPREISAQGVFNGYGDGQPISGRPDGRGAGFGRPDVLPTGDIGRQAGNVDGIPIGERSRLGHVEQSANSSGQGRTVDARPLRSESLPSDSGTGREGGVGSRQERADRVVARLSGGSVGTARRPVGNTDLSGDVSSVAAFNRDPSPRRSDVAGQVTPNDAPRQTTGAVSARPDLDAKLSRADDLFARDTAKPGSVDPATGEPYRKIALRLTREVEQAAPGYRAGKIEEARTVAGEQARAKQAAEPKAEPSPQTDLFGDALPPAKPRNKPPYEEKVDLASIKIKPEMQYKTGTNKDAVTSQFARETDFKLERAGRGTIYRERHDDGTYTDYAVDLHHRTELFKRAKSVTTLDADGNRVPATDTRVNVQVLDSADGWTPAKAKRYGITQNLAENKGEPLDAAEGLLGAGTLDEARRDVASMQDGELKRNTAGLIELDERGRELVSNNKVDKSVAAAIGTVLRNDPERQKIALADAIKSRGIRNYDDGAKLATTVLYEPAVAKDDGAQGGLFDGEGFDSGYISTAGKQTEIEQTIRQVLQRTGSDLLRPTTATLREGETIDTAGRQAEAAQIAETRSKADALFSYDPQVRKALRDAATAVQSGKATDAEAAQLVQQVVQERGKLSVADIVKSAGTEGEKARPAPLPARKRAEPKPEAAQQPPQTPKREIVPVYGPDNPRPTMEQRRAALEASRNQHPPQTPAPLAAIPEDDKNPPTVGGALTFRQRPAPAPVVPLAKTKTNPFATALKNPFKSKPSADGSPVPTMLQNIMSSRSILMLSGPATHLRNIKSNAGMQLMEEATKGPASGADILRVQLARAVGGQNTPLGRAIGTNRTAGGYSFGAFQKATTEAVKSGLPQAWENFRTGAIKDGKFDGKVSGGKFIPDETAASNLAKEALGSSAEYASKNELWNAMINFGGRALSSEDHVFKSFAWRRSIEEQAALIARAEKRANAKLPSDYVKNRIAELSKTPTDAMNQQAIVDAFVTTFNNENALNDVVTSIKNKNEFARTAGGTVVPYSKTPTNVIFRALEYSGLGLASGPIKAAKLIKTDLVSEKALAAEQAVYKTRPTSEQTEKIQKAAQAVMDKNFTPAEQRAMAQAMGRGTIGAGAIYLGYRLAENGYMTGKNVGQADYKKREDADEPEGAIYDPNTKRWFVVSDDVPLGAMLVLGATIKEREGAGIPPALGTLGAIGGQVNDIPALSAGDQIKDLTDVKNISRFPGSAVSSFVPAAVANVATELDPMRRKQGADKDAGAVKGVGQQLIRPTMARVPVLRTFLPENGPRKSDPFDPFKSQKGDKADPDLFAKRETAQYTTPRRKRSGLLGGDSEKGGDGDDLFDKRRGKRKSLFSD